MMNRRSQRQMKLIDCVNHGQDSELFIVEGESAANSVSALCDANFQAVLPLQGKPLNAYRASVDKVNQSPLHVQFAQAIGIAQPSKMTKHEVANLNFGRIYLLFDPDADGIHIGALMQLYLYKWLPELILTGKVYMLRVPMFAVYYQIKGVVHTSFAYLPEQLAEFKQRVASENGKLIRTERFQSLGSVPPDVLDAFCINTQTRNAQRIDEATLETVVAIFGVPSSKGLI